MVDVDSGLFSIVQMQRLTLLALVSHFRRFASCRRSALSLGSADIPINAHPSSFLGATMIPTARLVSSDSNQMRKPFIAGKKNSHQCPEDHLEAGGSTSSP